MYCLILLMVEFTTIDSSKTDMYSVASAVTSVYPY